MTRKRNYNHFCPVAKGAEIFAERWTPLVLRELMMGSTRFNDLRKGLPRISQSVLAQRLRDLEDAGIVRRVKQAGSKGWEYHLTPSGKELWPVLEHLGIWAYRWYQMEITQDDLDAALLMLDIRRGIKRDNLPKQKVTTELYFPDADDGAKRWWLIFEAGDVDLCNHNLGFSVDLYLQTSLLTMTRIWLGDTTMRQALAEGLLKLEGPARLIPRFEDWIGVGAYGAHERQRTRLPDKGRQAVG